MKPFDFRPTEDDKEELDWEDNWLSNTIAWLTTQVMPDACSTPGNIMPRISNYLWTSCPCCLFWRGALFGAVAPTIVIALIVLAIYVF
jgi:hypothetical protein